MRYKPKSVAALHIALGGLPDTMKVEAASGLSSMCRCQLDLAAAGRARTEINSCVPAAGRPR